MRVKCLAQEHNTMSPARARTRTTPSRDERTNHEASVPLTFLPRQIFNIQFSLSHQVPFMNCTDFAYEPRELILFHLLLMFMLIALFKSQFILAEHKCSTNWGDCKQNKSNQIIKSNKSNQIKCWFLRRVENRSSRRKTSWRRVESQQTQSIYDAGSGNRTRDTLVEGERSHHCADPAPTCSS